MKTKIFLLLLCALPLAGSAQKQGQPLIDSLLQVLPRLKEDTNKARALYRLSGSYSTIDIDKGFHYGELARALSKAINWKYGLARAYNALGLNYWSNGDYTTAINYFDTVITISRQIGDKVTENKGLLNTGSCYNLKGYYPKALDYYMKCLKVEEEIGDKTDEALCLNNISSVYYKTENFNDALKYGNQSYELFSQLGDKAGMARSSGVLADCYQVTGDLISSLRIYQRALGLYTLIEDRNGMAAILNGMGLAYADQGEYGKAITACTDALAIADSLGNEYEEGMMSNNIADAYLNAVIAGKVGQIKAAENTSVFLGKDEYLRRAANYLSGALKINEKQKDFDAFRQTYRELSKLDSLQGDYLGALEAFKKYTAYKDSVFNNNNKQTIQQLEGQRQIEVRDKEIQINKLQITNEQRQRWLYIIGIACLLLIGVLLFLRSRQRRRSNIKLQGLNTKLDEANKVKTRFFAILSHDLRSPVASLVNFLYLQKEAPDLIAGNPVEQQQRVENYASNLLNVMEDLLLWSKGQMDNFMPQMKVIDVKELFDEMAGIYTSTSELQVRFIAPVGDMELTTDENYLKAIMRNFTSNAIKVLKDKPDGLVEWKAWRNGSETFLSISDNGPGISPAQQKALYSSDASIGTRNGLGLHLIRDLANALHCTIAVDSTQGAGTTFTLSIPQA